MEIRPERMNAVQFDEAGASLVVRPRPVPRPGPGEVLIRMAAAPINPSDLRFLAGAPASAARNVSPVVPGLEGSGTVVAAGPGLVPRLLVGRRVAFASAQGGTWAEYAVTPAMRCIPLRRAVSLEQAATLIVNPLTALALFDLAQRGRHVAIVSTAAASAVGQMIVRLGRTRGITVVNVVRRPEHVGMLRALGAEHVLAGGDSDFVPRLRALVLRFNATLFLDAVGGTETQTLVEVAPFGSTVLAYGALAGETSAFNTRTLIVGDKRIVGFYLGTWLMRRGRLGTLRDIVRVQRLVGTDLQTSVRRRLPLARAQDAVDLYRAGMTGGKVLLVADPGQVPLG